MPISGLTLDQARDAVGLYIEQQWQADATYGEVPIAYGNIDFDPSTQTSSDVGYIEVTFLPGDSVQVGTSGGSDGTPWRQFGIAMVDIFSPLGAGETAAMTKAQTVSTALLGVNVSGVQFRGPSIVVVGPDEEFGWHHVSVSFDFFYTYHKT